ncbi:MAG: MerR family transcriptional regulator, partial [Acidimicrobiales bacterium]
MGDRAYKSIGEVLSDLKAEFPDVTISKIRFLESQGLLDPERTASGYRKFYEPDVERLRWILRQQREHFLPLKVIKGRLGVSLGDDAATEDEGAIPAVAGGREPAAALVDAPAAAAPPGPG